MIDTHAPGVSGAPLEDTDMTKLEAAMAAMAFAHVVAMIDQGPHNTQDENDLNLLKAKLRDDLATGEYLPALPPPGGITTPPPGGTAGVNAAFKSELHAPEFASSPLLGFAQPAPIHITCNGNITIKGTCETKPSIESASGS